MAKGLTKTGEESKRQQCIYRFNKHTVGGSHPLYFAHPFIVAGSIELTAGRLAEVPDTL